MHHNYSFPNVDVALPRLLVELDQRGQDVGSRNGRCIELTHVGLALTQPWQREITIPFRKPNLAAQIAETMWVLAGRSDMEFLSAYLPRAKDFSDDGKTWRAGYGQRLRGWEKIWGGTSDGPFAKNIDQWAECIRLLSEDPMTRRAVMSIWDPAMDYADSKDIPCNDWLSWSSRQGHLDLMVGVRSNDIIWGWSGINTFEWSALLEVTAGILGLRVGALHFATTSLHLYEPHFAKAKQIVDHSAAILDPLHRLVDSPRFELPRDKRSLEYFDALVQAWFQVEKHIRTGSAPQVEIDRMVHGFPEPMLKSWLCVLRWWWSGDLNYIQPLEGTRLEAAVHASVAPPNRQEQNIVERLGVDGVMDMMTEASRLPSRFITTTCSLHDEKHEAYGDSWKRRGEMLGIMANIARKVDRLGQGETADETSADTAQDLFVYLCKYRAWLDEQVEGPIFVNWGGTDTTLASNEIMLEVDRTLEYNRSTVDLDHLMGEIREQFDILEQAVNAKADRMALLRDMIVDAYRVARFLWEGEQPAEKPVSIPQQYRGADVD